MFKKNFLIKSFVWVIVFSFCISYGFAEEVGKITYVDGRADILKPGSERGIPIREYENISIGDCVRTKSNSKLEIKFKDDSILRLAQNSKIEIKDYKLDEKNKRKQAVVKLERGKVRAIVAKMPQAADFAILTPNIEGVVKGSDVFAFFQAGSSSVLVAEGKVALTPTAHPQNILMIPAGSLVVVPLEQLPQGPRPYLDLEKKLYEQDTDIPFSGAKTANLTVITGTIAKFSGIVQITAKGQAKAHDAKLGEIVREGDLIETGNNGSVEIRLDNTNSINIKPESKLAIVKLAYNPESGEYENIFDLTIGKIKARIEGLKGKSKFEIKTPLAICGARGTIMYVNSLLNNTISFLEGGNGYIINNLDGSLNDVTAGSQGSVDEQGGFSTSEINQDQRQDFTEGWDIGSGVEGYSSPEANNNDYLYNSDTAGDNTVTDNIDTDTGLPVDLSFSETNPITTTTTTTTPATLSGDFLGNFAWYDSWNGPTHEYLHMSTDAPITNGGFIGTGILWSGSQSVTLSGNFTLNNLDNHDLDLWAVGFNDLYGTTADDARFLGTAGGIRSNNNSLKGTFYALYVRPLNGGYQAGYLSSTDLFGNIDSGLSGGFSTSGTLSYYDRGLTTLLPADISRGSDYIKEGNEQGKVGGGSSLLSGTVKINTFDLKDPLNSDSYDWGIWRVSGGGSYTSAPKGSWSVPVGGSSTDDDTGITNAYWLGTFGSDNAWGSQNFSAIMSGTVLSDDLLEVFNGTGYGIHYFLTDDETYRWEFLGAGENHKTFDLTSSGRFVAQGWNVPSGFKFDGQIGLIGPIWAVGATPDFISIGKFNSGGATQFAWVVKKKWGPGVDQRDGFVSRYDNDQLPITYTNTTYDDGSGIGNGIGSIYGLSAGVGGNSILKGKTASLYISPTGAAGVLSGDVNGKYYDGIEMYRLDGTLTKKPHAQNITILPQDLHSKISWDEFSRFDSDSGGFTTGGEIIANGYVSGGNGTMLNINGVTNANGYEWGIWNLVTDGTFTYPTSPDHSSWTLYDLTGMTTHYTPTGLTNNYVGGSWLGGITGTSWSGSNLEGTLDAIWIGLKKNGELSGRKVNGETTGNYVEVNGVNDTWQAGSAGEWVEVNSNLASDNLTANILALGLAANVQISEAYSTVMTGNGTGGISTASVDMHLYDMNLLGAADGIWAAIISGTYSADPTASWGATVTNSTNSVTLTGTDWANGQWAANVSGTVNGNSLTGEAAGTYAGNNFNGTGTGTYTAAQP